MKFEKQIERFVIRFVLGAAILVALCMAAFAYGNTVHGYGRGEISDAVRQAKDDAARQCSKGIEDVVITKQDCQKATPEATVAFCEVEIEATCKE